MKSISGLKTGACSSLRTRLALTAIMIAVVCALVASCRQQENETTSEWDTMLLESQFEIDENKCVIYHQGNRIDISDHELARICRDLIEKMVVEATGVARQAVLKETILSITDSQLAVELTYRQPTRFAVSTLRDTLDITGCLVPLSGKFYPGMLFYEVGGVYQSGPLINREGSERLQSMVTQYLEDSDKTQE